MAFQLNQKGVPGTFALLGGTAAWKNAGYPMDSSQSTPAVVEQPVIEQDKVNANSLKK